MNAHEDIFDEIFGKKKAVTKVSDIHDNYPAVLRMNFLRLSPSYNLAIKLLAHQKKLCDEDVIEEIVELYEAPLYQMRKRGHYKDNQEHFTQYQRDIVLEIFKKVMETASKFGDLNNEYNGKIKSRIGEYVTTPYMNYPHVGLIGVWNEYNQPHSNFIKDLDKFVSWAQDENGFEPALVLLVPLRAINNVVKREVTEFLEEFRHSNANRTYTEKVPFYGKRIRPDAILKKLKVLVGRFVYPELTLWELALKVNVSDVYTKINKSRSTGLSTLEKERLNVITSRLLHQAMILAENAAVGIFPMTQKNLIPNYDNQKTLERIQKMWPDIKP